MYTTLETRRKRWPGVLLLLVLMAVGCEGTPTAEAAGDRALQAPEGLSPIMGTTPAPMEAQIIRFLESWEAAWESMDGFAYGSKYAVDADFVNPLGGIVSGRQAISQVHAGLFGGLFKDSRQEWEVRRIVPIKANLALVDLNVRLTGFMAPPPGLVEHTPGVVLTRARMLLAREGQEWEILAQQLTALQPFISP